MMPFFLLPWAFLALLAIPALVVIYWMRNRFRRQTVSSLMLWLEHQTPREGGSRFDRLRTPLSFLLELLALLMLVIAAAGPMLPARDRALPLVVVLDDSFSMRAGGEASPRVLAVEALREELDQGRYTPHFLIAGPVPQLLSATETLSEDAWRCLSPVADLPRAISFAAEVGGPDARILVLTDQAPPQLIPPGQVRWRAFGAPRPNLAFVNASRIDREGRQRCLLEIANLSATARRANVMLTLEGQPEPFRQETIELASGEVHRMALDLDDDAPALRASLEADPLEVDNALLLLPHHQTPVRLRLDIQNEALREPVQEALDAANLARLTVGQPELVITDSPSPLPTGWTFQILTAAEGSAYVGPFIVDQTHPLTEGLDLRGVIWGATDTPLPGQPVVAVGDVPLLTDTATADQGHLLQVQIIPELATLTTSPNWPILFWNLLQWRIAQRPGVDQVNVRVGSDVQLRLPRTVQQVQILTPTGESRTVEAPGGQLTLRTHEPGVYQIQAGESLAYRFAANPLDRAESGLDDAVTGAWGDWTPPASDRWAWHDLAWLFVFLALGLLAAHLILLTRASGGKP